MKLLILLVTLLVLLANPSLSNPTKINFISTYNEIKVDLQGMQNGIGGLKQQAFDHTVKFQTLQDVKNACECEAPFVQHLNDALLLVKEVLPLEEIDNILDSLHLLMNSLKDHHLLKLKKPSDNCHFRTHTLSDASLKKNLIKDNIDFIENWNANCKQSHKRN